MILKCGDAGNIYLVNFFKFFPLLYAFLTIYTLFFLEYWLFFHIIIVYSISVVIKIVARRFSCTRSAHTTTTIDIFTNKIDAGICINNNTIDVCSTFRGNEYVCHWFAFNLRYCFRSSHDIIQMFTNLLRSLSLPSFDRTTFLPSISCVCVWVLRSRRIQLSKRLIKKKILNRKRHLFFH